MLANAVVEMFEDGGPIMWPILAVALMLVAAIAERSVFWLGLRGRRSPEVLDAVLTAMEQDNLREAAERSKDSADPIVRMVHHGLTHVHGSLAGALQVAAGLELRRAGRFMVVIDTCITLAPLFGLLGTVVGIMGSFKKLTGDLAVEAVSKGIGEALIATAAGLGIAIAGVFFLNLFNEFLARLQYDLETAATNVEVLVTQGRSRGIARGEDQSGQRATRDTH